MRATFQPCSGLITHVTLLVCSIGLHLSCSLIVLHPLPRIVGWTRRKGSLVCPLFNKSNQLVPTQGSLDSFVSDAFAGWTRRKGSLDSILSDAFAGWTRHKGSLVCSMMILIPTPLVPAVARGSLAPSLLPVLLIKSCVPLACHHLV